MKKTVLLILAMMLLVPILASAELSTNLKVETVMVRNNNRLVSSKTFVDGSGNPVIPSDKGYATLKYSYTTGNRVSREDYLDAQGNPINNAEGFAAKTTKYSAGKVTETAYFDQDGKPVNGPDGYARQESKYRGRKHQSTWNYDQDGKPVNGPDGYARQESKYRGRKHQSTWNYDLDGNPVGTHRITEYYANNQVKSDTWYDAENNLLAGPDGYAKVEYKYNGRTKSRIAYIGEDGAPYYNAKEQYATMESVYKNGKIQSTYYYGADGNPVAGPKGYAYILYTYQNKTVTEMYYNADGSF